MAGVTWTEYEKSVITDNYPDGGWEAVHALLPHRPRSQITSKASLMGVALKQHRGGTASKNGGAKPKDDEECKPYPWEPLDAATLALQQFGCVTRIDKPLRPMVRVELEAAA
jgi:hypothetical protein